MKNIWLITGFFIYLYSRLGQAEDELRSVGKQYYEELFASSVIMSDSDLISLGFKSFDPNAVFKSDNDNFGNTEALNNRHQISVYNLPLHFHLNGASSEFSHQFTLKLSYFSLDEEVALVSGVPTDHLQQEVYSANVAYTLEYFITHNWRFYYGLGAYLMYADNHYDFNSLESQVYQPYLDGTIFNMSVWSTLLEPYVELKYHQDTYWGRWAVLTQWHYFSGVNWYDGQYGKPKGWRVSNGVQLEYDLAHFSQFKPSLYGNFKRIDIGQDATSILQTHTYYEAGIGIVWSNLFDWDWIDTVGVGVNFNYGSSLRGGSLLFYINPFND